MADIAAIAANLELRNGIWVTRESGDVSYPAEGNENCFSVEDSSYWFQHRNRVIEHLVNARSPEQPFFDIGGGNGCVSHALQLSGLDVVLVEPGPSGARNAVRRGVQTVVQSTLEDAGFMPDSLPSVGLFDVLEHIETDLEFLKSIHRFLIPNGFLYVTVPAYRSLWSVDDVHAGHFRRYTVSSLQARLREAGFTVEYSTYLFSFLVPPIFLLRSLPSVLGLRNSVSKSRIRKEHSRGNKFSGAILDRCLQFELNRIKRGRRIPVGSSCLAIASKRAD